MNRTMDLSIHSLTTDISVSTCTNLSQTKDQWVRLTRLIQLSSLCPDTLSATTGMGGWFKMRMHFGHFTNKVDDIPRQIAYTYKNGNKHFWIHLIKRASVNKRLPVRKTCDLKSHVKGYRLPHPRSRESNKHSHSLADSSLSRESLHIHTVSFKSRYSSVANVWCWF